MSSGAAATGLHERAREDGRGCSGSGAWCSKPWRWPEHGHAAKKLRGAGDLKGRRRGSSGLRSLLGRPGEAGGGRRAAESDDDDDVTGQGDEVAVAAAGAPSSNPRWQAA